MKNVLWIATLGLAMTGVGHAGTIIGTVRAESKLASAPEAACGAYDDSGVLRLAAGGDITDVWDLALAPVTRPGPG